MKKNTYSLLLIIGFISLGILNTYAQSGKDLRFKLNSTFVKPEVDKENGTTKKTLNVYVPSLKYMAETSFGIVEYSSGDNGTRHYTMYSYLYKSNWLFVDQIEFDLDGKKISFSAIKDFDKTKRDVQWYGPGSGVYVSELNWYEIDESFVKELKNAKEISYRLIGDDIYMEMKLKKKHKEAIQKFYPY